MYTCIGHIHLLAIYAFFFTPHYDCILFYGPIVPEINYSILFYNVIKKFKESILLFAIYVSKFNRYTCLLK